MEILYSLELSSALFVSLIKLFFALMVMSINFANLSIQLILETLFNYHPIPYNFFSMHKSLSISHKEFVIVSSLYQELSFCFFKLCLHCIRPHFQSFYSVLHVTYHFFIFFFHFRLFFIQFIYLFHFSLQYLILYGFLIFNLLILLIDQFFKLITFFVDIIIPELQKIAFS